MLNKRFALTVALALVAMAILAACGGGTVQTVIVTQIIDGEVVEVPVTVEGPAAEPEAVQDTIIVCMSQEPDSLYRVTSNMSVTVWVVQAASSLGWYPDRAFDYETRTLVNNEFPSFENGGATLEGEGSDAVLSVTYQFKEGITWSDGEPFSVDDILFTREVVIDPDSGAISRGTLDQMVYEKIDEVTLKVTYPAGVLDPRYFLPPLSSAEGTATLPEHILGSMTPEEITTSEFARLPNPVLGPYEFVEWVEGDHIEMKAVEGWWGGDVQTPKLIFRFITDTNQLLASTLSGECDIATSDGLQSTQLPFIQQSADKGLLAYSAIPALVWEHIDMNQFPAEGAEADGLAFFADKRVRQAVAYGTNRLEMTEQILYGEVQPLNSWLPADHWAYNTELDGTYEYNPDTARALLADAGWVDGDEDGIVEASTDLTGEFSCGRGEWTIPADTAFSVSFHTTTGNSMRDQLSTIFNANMADIGLDIAIDLLPASVWFADDGPLFTLTYQIGEFAWGTDADPSGWFLYGGMNIYKTPDGEFLVAQTILDDENFDLGDMTEFDFKFGRPTEDELPEGYTVGNLEQIPADYDNYEGGNDLGWCDEEMSQLLFDGDNKIENEERLPFFLEAQLIFNEEMPSLPLFQRISVTAFASDLCGVDLGPANSPTWNVETWTFGDCE